MIEIEGIPMPCCKKTDIQLFIFQACERRNEYRALSSTRTNRYIFI